MTVQTFVVEINASVMPPLTEAEVQDAVARAAFAKEREHGMGSLAVFVYEAHNHHAAALIPREDTP